MRYVRDQDEEDVAVSIQLQSTGTQLQRHLISLLHSLQLPGKCTTADTVSTDSGLSSTEPLGNLTRSARHCVTTQ